MFSLTSPVILPKLFPCFTWSLRNESEKVYLTFDDGPVPGVTKWVLDVLHEFNAKATFFCLGKNVKQNPDLFQQIITDGHAVGNHTFNHMKGWNTNPADYVYDVEQAEKIIKSEYFRPPYGKITPAQVGMLKRKKYKIVMWDVLTRDFDARLSGSDCFENVRQYTRPGSIIVFHDSYKAEKNLRYTLPRTLEYLMSQNLELGILQ